MDDQQPFLSRLPLAPTYNSSNPFLATSQANHAHETDPDAPSSVEKPLREVVRTRNVLARRGGRGEGEIDVTAARIADSSRYKRERVRSESTSLGEAAQEDPAEGEKGLTMPRRPHAARRRDLRLVLRHEETPKQPVFTPRQDETEAENGDRDEDMEDDDERDSVDEEAPENAEPYADEYHSERAYDEDEEREQRPPSSDTEDPNHPLYYEWNILPRLVGDGLVLVPKPEGLLPEPVPQAPPGQASEDLYDEAMENQDWTAALDIVEDIRKVNDGVKGWETEYKIVDRLGEGTFSSVYKAIDVKHEQYKNARWTATADMSGYDPADATALATAGRSKVYVALKRIYVTSSPDRISNELEIMEELRGCRNVIQLISAHRHEDQVFAVMPYHHNDDYRLFYRHFDPTSMRSYFSCMFRALADTHDRGIIHRDVKPANFLYDYRTGNGVLVDFGLAEHYEHPSKILCQHTASTKAKPHGARCKTGATDKVEAAFYEAAKKANLPEGRVGFPSQDTRPSIKANRAGTRGFRAPEVLLKCPDQTYAIDIWAAGVILLSVLTHKFPLFNSNDDIEALMEIGAIVGLKTLTRCAILHNRTILCNVPSMRDERGQTLQTLIERLNPRVYTPPSEKCTREEAREHIESIDSAMDLLQKLLVADQTKRWTAKQALEHPFLKQEI